MNVKSHENLKKIVNETESNKFLTFILGKEIYGVEILKVREIIGLMEITEIPKTPEFIKGVINLRGSVIPVIDLRLKFEMKEAVYTDETCIIVLTVELNNESVLIGIIVDTVREVSDIDDKDIDPAPSFGDNIKTEYIYGMGKLKDKVIILLDINKVISIEELEIIKKI